MTYHLDKGRNNKKRGVWLFFVAFFCLVFFWPQIRPMLYQGTESFSKRMFEITGASYIVPDFIEMYFSSRNTLYDEKKSLEQQVETLESKVKEQDLYIQHLSVLLGGSASSSLSLGVPIIASSLVQDVTKLYATVIFGKGFGDGVEVGDTVYVRGRQAVCVIKEVFSRTSTCELFSGFGNSVEGVTSSSSLVLTLSGRGGHFIGNVVRDTQIQVGEKVFLKENQTFLLGEVTDIINNNQDTSWHVLVRGGYNPSATSLYYIEKKLQK